MESIKQKGFFKGCPESSTFADGVGVYGGILCLMEEAGNPTMTVAYGRLQGEGWQVTPGFS